MRFMFSSGPGQKSRPVSISPIFDCRKLRYCPHIFLEPLSSSSFFATRVLGERSRDKKVVLESGKSAVLSLPSDLHHHNCDTHTRINMRGVTRDFGETLFVLGALRHRTFVLLAIVFAILWLKKSRVRETRRRIRFSILDRIPSQIRQMNELVEISDEVCKNNLRMDCNSFQRLCYLLHDVGGP
ncbi:hypothetical protein ACS0TY_012189 [Phlomoides rotata]